MTSLRRQLAPGTDHPENYFENGRIYHGFRKGLYMCPCDETEKERLDIFHHIIYVCARREELHKAPLTRPKDESSDPHPLRILDVGCGSGIWAIDMADAYPDAEVRGVDLSLIQPERIPPNARFRRFDFESPWIMGEDSWDLIHFGMLCGSVQDWTDLYANALRHLKPGVGYLEQVEIDFEPRCDDGTLPDTSPWRDWYHRYLKDATSRYHHPIAYDHNTPQTLRDQGFVDVQTTKIRLPVGEWSRSPGDIDTGRWWRTGLCEAIEPLSLAVFTRPVWGWPIQDVKRYISDVDAMVRRADIHAYNDLYVITARKPGRDEFKVRAAL